MAKRILFVDDEAGIRMTLGPILERNGFEVTITATVADALHEINHNKFDVLLSDLNIGQPGDGFTVVSAMRRVQPEAATFILTGYPDFETALQAIRNQVDDYLLKPTDVPTLLGAIERRLQHRRPAIPELAVKRVSQLLRETAADIAEQWLEDVQKEKELQGFRLSREERARHILPLLRQLAHRVDESSGYEPDTLIKQGQQFGQRRAELGYSAHLVVVEMRILQRVISSVLQHNLIRMDLSSVIADMMEVGEGLQEHLEHSIRSFQSASREAA
ncbi:MAG TPA: response regulator [Candidatus Limnocylindrales bacterium]|jgi:ActR/RegA family two-component response regulator|nr:response regulator [Candidatus Limnocylindrales bacterium]